jgi:hypothetical protein
MGWEQLPHSAHMPPLPPPFPHPSTHSTLKVDAGCDADLVFGDPTAPRFVYWEKKLRATPSGPDVLTFDLLSVWGKIRAGLGAVGLVKGGPMPGAGGGRRLFLMSRCLCAVPCVAPVLPTRAALPCTHHTTPHHTAPRH